MADKVEDCLQDLRYSIIYIYIYIYTQKKVLVSGYKDPLHNYLSRKRKAKEEKNKLVDQKESFWTKPKTGSNRLISVRFDLGFSFQTGSNRNYSGWVFSRFFYWAPYFFPGHLGFLNKYDSFLNLLGIRDI